ncbi:Lsr2 family protein [Microbacterium sp. 3J1]|uniref:histone-like nucleoid-structuring protein Lsr2 n=1 Tax=Microbacterium sp. 3J1 TaxID=861269 RepID=UPI000B2A8A6E|nr:Lsr2 family protein [Microbacterium sp. 3J1]
MARRIVHQLVDDIDGSVLEVGEGETVHFSLNGTSYEIDLNSAHAEELRAALEPYISAGRRAGSAGAAGAGRSSSSRKRPARNPEVAAIRAWANDNGYTLSERGRIPAPVVEAYNAAH